MDDLSPAIQIIENYGFPILVSIYLLVRFEKKLDSLADSINKLIVVIEKANSK